MKVLWKKLIHILKFMDSTVMSAVAKTIKLLIFLYSQTVLAEAGVLWVRGTAHENPCTILALSFSSFHALGFIVLKKFCSWIFFCNRERGRS